MSYKSLRSEKVKSNGKNGKFVVILGELEPVGLITFQRRVGEGLV